MLPNKNSRLDPNVADEDGDTLTAEEIWPKVKSGPNKGQIAPRRDARGNVIVDPAGNIVKESYLLDYNVYKSLHAQEGKKKSQNKSETSISFKNFNKNKKEIKKLYLY